MAKQSSFRVSDATAQQLAWLTQRYGNQTTVLTVAIDRFYRQERSTMPFSEVIASPHFQTFSEFLHTPLRSQRWRQEHPRVPIAQLEAQVVSAATAEIFATNRQECTNRLLRLLSAIAEADLDRSYTEEDLAWLVEILDGSAERALAVLWMLLAHATAPPSHRR